MGLSTVGQMDQLSNACLFHLSAVVEINDLIGYFITGRTSLPPHPEKIIQRIACTLPVLDNDLVGLVLVFTVT